MPQSDHPGAGAPDDAQHIQHLHQQIAGQLREVAGVAAIALGGSRAQGTHTPTSDSDIGLYYHGQTLNLAHLKRVGATLDDQRRADVLTDPGAWGPWINGGGWLAIDGHAVDILYRDLDTVSSVLAECVGGHVQAYYQPGHPLGFVSSIYLAEVAICQPLWDNTGELARLKAQTTAYPPLLKRATLAGFWEATFSAQVARKGAARGDCAYVAGALFRGVGVLAQALFALNERYWLNEKGAIAQATIFPLTPKNLSERITTMFAQVTPNSLEASIALLESLIEETQALLDSYPL